MASIPPPYAPREHAQGRRRRAPHSAHSLSPIWILVIRHSFRFFHRRARIRGDHLGVSGVEAERSASDVRVEQRGCQVVSLVHWPRSLPPRKCVKSAVFGDADNLWEVLWYPNSGVQGGEYASLYLSCVVSESKGEMSLR